MYLQFAYLHINRLYINDKSVLTEDNIISFYCIAAAIRAIQRITYDRNSNESLFYSFNNEMLPPSIIGINWLPYVILFMLNYISHISQRRNSCGGLLWFRELTGNKGNVLPLGKHYNVEISSSRLNTIVAELYQAYYIPENVKFSSCIL